MRRSFIVLFICLLHTAALMAQQASPNNSGNIYALVVGIANYQNKDIPQLQYANRDAEVFAEYLKSKAGGSVPAENIQLLVDSAATTGAVYDAIYWLSKTCQKGDLVYFYFSGHGDLETVTMFQNGFLICWDSPPNNYVKLALSVDYLNNIANTLSAQTNANVVLITDACHSGKLAGSNNRGNFLVAEQLREIKNKEIRITSCAPEQVSHEDEAWGGGRGVFSYYLVNGLKGLADKSKDGVVTLDEIKAYMDAAFNRDPILKKENITQTPVLNGRPDFALAKVDQATRKQLENQLSDSFPPLTMTMMSAPRMESLPADAQDYFFARLKNERLEDLIQQLKLDQLPVEAVAPTLIKLLQDSSNSPAHVAKLGELQTRLNGNKAALDRFNSKLAVAFDKAGQQVITQYLAGDEAELERRRYYNANNNGYDIYPKMFALALKLVAADNSWRNILEVKLHYFSGVAIRLRMPLVENREPLIDSAMAEQKKALALEDRAAYIYNELGALYLMKGKYDEAEKHFKKAIERAPEWVLPRSNLVAIYAYKKDFAKAQASSDTAMQLKPGFQGNYVNAGMLNERKGDLLLAEEMYRKSIRINSRHYLPFERLGFVDMSTTQYALADSMFYEADIRKRGYHFRADPFPIIEQMDVADGIIPPCNVEPGDVSENDVLGHFALGFIEGFYHNDAAAEWEYKKVIELDKTNPLAFHYLGVLLYNQERWQEADIILNLALKYHPDRKSFQNYLDSMSKLLPETNSKTCIIKIFNSGYYAKEQDLYFLGRLYEKWHHYTEAEAKYREAIKLNPGFIGGYYKLWTLLEKINRYRDAETVLQTYSNLQSTLWQGNWEMAAFYKRMAERMPQEGEWIYKAGLYNYHLAATWPDRFKYDLKEMTPDDSTVQSRGFFESQPRFISDDHNIPGTYERINYYKKDLYPFSDGTMYLLKADSLMAADEASITDINDKLGDLYVWQGLPEKSIAPYLRSLSFQPENTGVRLKLINSYDTCFQYQAALKELTLLKNNKEINFPKMLLLAKYLIHSGSFDSAQLLLLDAEKIHPYKMPQIADLSGRLNLLEAQYKDAIGYYKQYMALNKNDYACMYSIARLYAKMGNSTEAWNWLQASLKNGFNFSYVLQYDPFIEIMRKSPKWKTMVDSREMKKYPPPKKSFLPQ